MLFTRVDGRERWELRENDNQFVSIYTSLIDLIQNITQRRDRKPDDCDAESMRVRAVF
jgi:hypothetical protein